MLFLGVLCFLIWGGSWGVWFCVGGCVRCSLVVFVVSVFLLSSIFNGSGLFLMKEVVMVSPNRKFLSPNASCSGVCSGSVGLGVDLCLGSGLSDGNTAICVAESNSCSLSAPGTVCHGGDSFSGQVGLVGGSGTSVCLDVRLGCLDSFGCCKPRMFCGNGGVCFTGVVRSILGGNLGDGHGVGAVPGSACVCSELGMGNLLVSYKFLSGCSSERGLVAGSCRGGMTGLVSGKMVGCFSWFVFLGWVMGVLLYSVVGCVMGE